MIGMDKRLWFSPPVSVWIRAPKMIRYNVNNVPRAAELLLTEWPVEGGKAHRKAQSACLDCLEGRCDADAVRKAFEEAAREAGILHE